MLIIKYIHLLSRSHLVFSLAVSDIEQIQDEVSGI